MKANKYVKECGPYYITSHSQGDGTVHMTAYPAFPKYDLSPKELSDKHTSGEWKVEPHWANHRAIGQGGGPSIFSSMACAEELSKFLNQPYQEQSVKDWEKRIKKILDDKSKNIIFKHCDKCAYVTSAPKEWKFCPECGNRLKED